QNLVPITLDASKKDHITDFVRNNTDMYGHPDRMVMLTFGEAGKRFSVLDAISFDKVCHLGIKSTWKRDIREALCYFPVYMDRFPRIPGYTNHRWTSIQSNMESVRQESFK